MDRCMIPRQVTTRPEILPGVGLREIVATALGALIGYALHKTFALLLSSAPEPLRAFCLYVVPLLMPVAGFALVLNGEQSILSLFLRAAHFRRRPGRLFYRLASAATPPPSGGATPVTLLSPVRDLLSLVTGSPKKTTPERIPETVQQWLPVHDILPGGILQRRDGYLVGAVRVEPRNISLLSEPERRRLLRGVQAAINPLAGTSVHLQFLSLARPIDLDAYLRRLDAALPELSPARQRLLRAYIRHVADLVAGGEAFERRHYLLLAHPPGKHAMDQLRQHLADLAARLRQADIAATVVDDRELIALLYVFHHPVQAAFERPATAPYLTTLPREATNG